MYFVIVQYAEVSGKCPETCCRFTAAPTSLTWSQLPQILMFHIGHVRLFSQVGEEIWGLSFYNPSAISFPACDFPFLRVLIQSADMWEPSAVSSQEVDTDRKRD